MKSKAVFLTALFTIGFTLPGCFCNCPKIRGQYYDVREMKVANIMTPEGYRLLVDFDVSYYNFNKSQPEQLNFSLMNSAYACSCLKDGEEGSKEKLHELTVITKNDFDPQHLANDTINDLLDIQMYPATYDLQSYLQQDTSGFLFRNYNLILKKKPQLNKEFKVEVNLKLDNGEVYQKTNEPIYIE
ncbi:hypothetical protein GXP67_34025 [Rhodocytophaga rosea]|uniref:DUF5034 domain-containing protein n=1 Tax=Rhodocytophaga rosea TaxID=2704465 RepID=A0A6C0GVF5_9BACT|nr:hypothetical protein [Rhodocytophaga rosea]QHT71320.1 hypothetical protein GXP67_34025 [Rhodocytophaga rosea]